MKSTDLTTPALPKVLRDLFEAKLASGDIELPFLPDTPARVMAACNEEKCDARQLAELIQRDQALAGHVLRVSNSAAYAPKEPIVSLQHAVSRLGMGTICEIAMAVSMKGRVFRVPGYQVKIREMWQHSAIAGTYAKEIARLRRFNVEGAFMGGLLHDVGKPIVMTAFLDILAQLTQERVPVRLLESAMDAFHERVGAMLIENWSLPRWVHAAIRHHHDYTQAEDYAEEAATAHLADLLAHWAFDVRTTAEDFDHDLPVLVDLNLYSDQLELLLQRRGDVLEIADAFT